MKQTAKISNKEISDLVIARIKPYPPKRKIHIGSYGSFTAAQLIEKIKRQEPVGKKIIEIQLNYLRSLKNYNLG